MDAEEVKEKAILYILTKKQTMRIYKKYENNETISEDSEVVLLENNMSTLELTE